MPSLPRIRRTRPGSGAVPAGAGAERRALELTAPGLTWVHLERPNAAAAHELAERFGWHELDVEDVLSKRQRPKVDEYPEYLFGVLHFPVYDKTIQRLNAAELDVFLGPDYLVTMPNVELLPVARLFHRLEEDERLRADLLAKGSGRLLYEVLDDLFDYCFPILDKIGHKLDSVEDDMFERRAEDVVRDLSNVKQEIISYRKIIKPERSTLRVLERRVERFLPEELDLYFDDIVDAAERIWDLLDNYKEVVEGLESTNESVISHRQNDVLRILTVFSATLLPLTLLASVFGMNVAFPGSGTAHAFWVIVAVMLAAGGGAARLLPLETLDLRNHAGLRCLGRVRPSEDCAVADGDEFTGDEIPCPGFTHRPEAPGCGSASHDRRRGSDLSTGARPKRRSIDSTGSYPRRGKRRSSLRRLAPRLDPPGGESSS